MQVVTTNRRLGKRMAFLDTSSWDVLFSYFLVVSLSDSCYKEVRYDMGEPMGNFPLLKQYQALHVK